MTESGIQLSAQPQQASQDKLGQSFAQLSPSLFWYAVEIIFSSLLFVQYSYIQMPVFWKIISNVYI